ncbi:MAG: hypothetical protein DCO96_01755 [Fluviicola sp. XM-24bin1]|nr:MAG: hypothetical protein DCO96_01755 [Fluviicola sp. XM-24bin1]
MSYSGIILAGGKSSRMGQDKALMEFDGIPMIQHVADTLRDYTSEVIIASNFLIHHPYGDRGVQDDSPHLGPLAGIEAGLSTARNEASIVISCDAPFVNASVLERLIQEEQEADDIYDVFVAVCDGRDYPLIAIYRESCLKTVRRRLEKRQLRLGDLLVCLNLQFVMFPESESKYFLNINTQEEWNQALGK